ncbi:MAG: hypothetical protein DHS20C20_22600 [Ardenticatenaceae bacterium]|nr:MAG: hypothetical protein DHS20C20_22600 [Ardenticatenaceae bacterium]
MIQLKRAYDKPEKADGRRFLVDRLWPRGVKKENLALSVWLKEVAPSNELRHWFGHDPQKWPDFQQRYRDELDAKPESIQPLLTAAQEGKIMLVYGARDTKHNDAVVLKAYLEEKLAS